MTTALVTKTISYVRKELEDAEGGHDWWHIHRVWNTSLKIARHEKVDLLVVQLGALLHDIADSKFHDGNEQLGPEKARQFLRSIEAPKMIIDHVVQIVTHISFKGGYEEQKFRSPELNVVQDADGLDAMGAIGIARAFHYGGHKGRLLYHPEIKPNLNMTKEEYKNSTAPTINHFYEKLLLLKDRMNTETGKLMAHRRHAYIEGFLKEFMLEWEGKF